MKQTLTAIIIAKNEELRIADCLESVSFCDERIVIDGGSIDRTSDIAKHLGASVFTHKTENFAEMRNLGLSKAKGNWILYIDADERVSKELEVEIKRGTQVEGINAFRIKRKNFYFGNHEWPKIEKLERFFRRRGLKEWYGELHESPRVEGNIDDLDGFLLHFTHRDLTSMLEKTIEWSKVEAELRYKAHHPKITWWRFPRVMLTAFFDSYIKQQGYKAGTVGIIESIYQSFSMFITYARLWEMQQPKRATKNTT